MFFRNLSLYRFPDATIASAATFAEAIAEHPLREVGALELSTRGFVPPVGRDGPLTLDAGTCTAFAIGMQERILPPAVIADELARRLADIAEREARRVSGRERKQIREAIITEFLPRAFTRTRRTLAYVDIANGWLVVDTSTRAVAETVIGEIREALGSFPATPLTPEESPRVLMTHWLNTCEPPAGMELGDDCELRDPAEAGAIARISNQDMAQNEIIEHLRSGKQVFRLGLVFGERLSLNLGQDLGIKKLRFLDTVLDQLGDDPAESAEEEALSCFTLMTLELRHLLDWIELTFRVAGFATLTLDGGDAPKSMREAAKREKAIRITAEMYAARDAAKRLLADKYLERTREWGELITDEAERTGGSLTSAALALAEKVQADGHQACIPIAALCELLEPSPSPAALVNDAKMVRALSELAPKSGTVTISVAGQEGVTLTPQDRERMRRHADRLDAMKGKA